MKHCDDFFIFVFEDVGLLKDVDGKISNGCQALRSACGVQIFKQPSGGQMVMVSMFYFLVVIVMTNLNVPRPSIFGAQTLEMFSGERLMMLLYFVVVIMMRN